MDCARRSRGGRPGTLLERGQTGLERTMAAGNGDRRAAGNGQRQQAAHASASASASLRTVAMMREIEGRGGDVTLAKG